MGMKYKYTASIQDSALDSVHINMDFIIIIQGTEHTLHFCVYNVYTSNIYWYTIRYTITLITEHN